MEGQQELLDDSVFDNTSVTSIVDELVKSPIEDSECLAYWAAKEVAAAGNVAKLALVSVARKYLTPAATSVDVERLFSECGNVLEARRNRTSPERANKMIFLRKNMYLLCWELNLS
jgi:hypothetical protein